MKLLAVNGKLICAEGGGGPGSVLNARTDPPGDGWEEFAEVDAGDGRVALRTDGGCYVSAQQDGTVQADRTEIGPWERWTKVVRPEGVGYRSDFGLFLCADLGVPVSSPEWSGCRVVANRGAMGAYETFTVSGAPAARRTGRVRLDGQAFADDGGTYLGLGATLFWAAWGYANDRARLEENLAFLSTSGVDYIRVLASVGSPTGTDAWNDRAVGPFMPDYDAVLAGLTDLAYDTYGLRIEWTLFGGSPHTATPAQQRDVVARIVEASRGREHKIQHWEVANEADANGFSVEMLRDAAETLRRETPILVALTSGLHTDPLAYHGSAANLYTIHLDRSTNGTGGVWRPARQAWEPQFATRLAWTNNEPTGPGSSVTTDSDPTRISMGAGLTWLCGGAGYVLHAGAGIFGKPITHPVGGFRPANIWEQPGIDAILAGLRAVRALLPPDLPNWARHNTNPNFPNYPFELAPLAPLIASEQLLRSFAATREGRVVTMPIVAKVAVPYVARWKMRLREHDPLTGAIRQQADVPAGGTFTLAATDAAIIIGEPI